MRSPSERSVAEDLADEPRGGDDSGGAIRQGAVEDEEVDIAGYEGVDVPGEGGGKDVGVVGITPLTTMFVSTSTRSISRRLAFTIALFANGIDFGGDDGHHLVGVHVAQLFANGFDGCHQTRRLG